MNCYGGDLLKPEEPNCTYESNPMNYVRISQMYGILNFMVATGSVPAAEKYNHWRMRW
jgi:hypothetical protein